jgi:hypothetical protein
MLCTGIVSVGSVVPFAGQLGGFSTSAIVVAVLLGGVFGAAGLWTVSATVVYVLTAFVAGSGSVRKVAANVGWAALPLLLVNTVSTATIWLLSAVGSLPAVTQAQLSPPRWLVLFNSAVGIVGYVWVGVLLTHGIRDARNLSLRRAALVAGIAAAVPTLNAISRVL